MATLTNSVCTLNDVSFNGANINVIPSTGATTFTGGLATSPVNSSVATTAFVTSLTAGSSVQNTTGYNLLCNICVNVTSSTTATITLGVGSATGPTDSEVINSFTAATATQKTFTALVPDQYYLVVNTAGTIVVDSIGVQSCSL